MKIGIIGCGMIAETHIRILSKIHTDADICLCDRNVQKSEEMASRWNVQNIFSDIHELLSKVRPDTVHVLTPPPSHFSLSKMALESGCHVFVEKPVTETLPEFHTLSNLAQAKRLLLYPGYSTLGMPVVLKAKKLISSGDLGRLIAIHCNYGCQSPGKAIPYGDPKHWAYFLRGGILQNMADHPASLLLDLMEPIERHHISVVRRNYLPHDCPDLLHVTVNNHDQIGSFALSIGHGSADRRAHLLFERGSMVIDMSRMLLSYLQGRGPHNFIKKGLSGVQEGLAFFNGTIKNITDVIGGRLQKEPGIFNVVHDFYNCIDGRKERLVSDQTVMSIVDLLDKVWTEIDYRLLSEGTA
jgi:predicted dehydrogenase